jgi:hypothetical protein
MSSERTEAVPAATETELPAVTTIRTRVIEAGCEAVAVEFANGAQVRYRETEAGIEEAWIRPGADPADPAVTHVREADAGAEALALRTLGEYLSFDGRRRAAFVWGEENVAAILGE